MWPRIFCQPPALLADSLQYLNFVIERMHPAQTQQYGHARTGPLVEQAAAAFEFWRGVRPPAGQVLGEMRKAMQSAPA
ncbi:MAG: hypothetical protein Q4F27_06125 [Desulfovibrionaceae bacterium]|nr:hypothetical protein [Desulfovibrionaceae bacterium]